MKRFAVLLAVVLLSIGLVSAGDRPHETSFSLAYTDIEDVGEQAVLSGDLLVPFGGHQLIGPAFNLSWMSPENGEDYSGGGLGGAWEINLFDGDCEPFVGLEALYITGDASDVFKYTARAKIGLKFGNEKSYVKAFIAKTRNFGVADVDDFDSTDLNVGIGLRF